MIDESIKRSCLTASFFLFLFISFMPAILASSDALLDIFWEAASTYAKARNPHAEIYKIDVGEVTRIKCPPKALMSEKHMHDFIRTLEGRVTDYKVLSVHKDGFVDLFNSTPTDFYIRPLETTYGQFSNFKHHFKRCVHEMMFDNRDNTQARFFSL